MFKVFIFQLKWRLDPFHAMEDDEVKYIKESSSPLECTSEDAEIIKKMHYKNTNQFVYP